MSVGAAFIVNASRDRVVSVDGAGSIALSITPSSASGVQGGTVDYTVSLDRVAFAGTVTPVLSGLPTGATGAFSPTTFTGDDSDITLTVTLAADAPAVSNDTLTITASGTGVSDATATTTLTITLSSNPTIAIAVTPSAASVEQDSVRDYTVTLTRTDTTETVTIAATGLPSDVTVTYPNGATYTGATASRIIRLSAASDAAITTVTMTVTATAPTLSNATATAEVSVIAPIASDAFVPNRPAGMATANDTTFADDFNSSVVTTVTQYTYGGFQFTKFAPDKLTVIADADAPSGTGFTSKHTFYEGGFAGVMSAARANALPASRTALFMAFSHEVVSPHTLDASGTKIIYIRVRSDGGSTQNGMFLSMRREDATLTCRYRWETGQVFGWNASNSSWTQPNLGENASGYSASNHYWMSMDTWYRTEAYLQLETTKSSDHAAGTANGVIKVWVTPWTGSAWGTPVLIMDYDDKRIGIANPTTSLVYAHGGSGKHFEPYKGGSGSPVAAQDQSILFDRLHFSGNT